MNLSVSPPLAASFGPRKDLEYQVATSPVHNDLLRTVRVLLFSALFDAQVFSDSEGYVLTENLRGCGRLFHLDLEPVRFERKQDGVHQDQGAVERCFRDTYIEAGLVGR